MTHHLVNWFTSVFNGFRIFWPTPKIDLPSGAEYVVADGKGSHPVVRALYAGVPTGFPHSAGMAMAPIKWFLNFTASGRPSVGCWSTCGATIVINAAATSLISILGKHVLNATKFTAIRD
jgi:hypothetical protein